VRGRPVRLQQETMLNMSEVVGQHPENGSVERYGMKRMCGTDFEHFRLHMLLCLIMPHMSVHRHASDDPDHPVVYPQQPSVHVGANPGGRPHTWGSSRRV
jgi:hypothetical protein